MKRMLRGADHPCRRSPPSFSRRSRRLARRWLRPNPIRRRMSRPISSPIRDPRWTSPEWSAEDIAALSAEDQICFVIFNENRSFDHEYGTFPGVNGLYSDGKNPRAPADTPGFTQSYLDTNTGQTVTVQPFRVGPEQNSTIKDFDRPFPHRPRRQDRRPERRGARWTSSPRSSGADTRALAAPQREAMGKQFARLVMAHIDCDTIPFFWRYASRFTIFDNIFATEDTPSTPERGRDDRRPIGRDPMGQAPERDQTPPRTASPGRSAARSTARPIPARRPRKGRRWSTIPSRGGAPSSTTRLPAASRPERPARNGITPPTSPPT